MKVLLAHSRYRYVGGEERHLDLLAAGLRECDVEVSRLDVDVPRSPGLMESLRLALGLIYSQSGADRVADIVDRTSPDVVHFHNLMPMLSPSALRAARRRGAAVILTVHNYRLFCPGGTMTRAGRLHTRCITGSSFVCGLHNPRGVWSESIAYGAALEIHRRLRLVQRWVDAFVVPAPHVRDLLIRAGFPKEKIHVIAYGIPCNATAPPPGVGGLYAGRLSAEKGVETLLRAAARASEVPLVIAGDGPLRELVENTTVPSVTYVGHVCGDDVQHVRRGAGFAVVPSEWPEILPFAALESLAEGLPVIVTPLGGLAEIASHGGCVVVDPADPEALAGAMRRVFQDSALRARLATEARRSAGENYELVRQAQRVLSLYQRVIARRTSSTVFDG